MTSKITESEIENFAIDSKVTYKKKGQSRQDLVCLVDFQNPHKNDFLASLETLIETTDIECKAAQGRKGKTD